MLSWERRHLVDILWFHKRPSGFSEASVAAEDFLLLEDDDGSGTSKLLLESDPGTETDAMLLQSSIP
jgi:hypothetical protein